MSQKSEKTTVCGLVQFYRKIDTLATAYGFLTFAGFCSLMILSTNTNPVQAQISVDDTVGTKADTTNSVTEITGGTTKGENLFHSFKEFSLSSGETAFFNNSIGIANIIGRVTGGSISEINGLIRANGDSNLVLINPNGINFGVDARLSIGGSFLGSTANSILFEDGSTFNAVDAETSPLLTVSIPVGLQLGQNAGAINIEGSGHDISLSNPIFSPFNRGNVSGLKMQTGKTLGLVGGDISLRGGVIASERGRVELGSVASGIVNLDFSGENLSLSYKNVPAFKNISLTQQSLVDVSGFNSGSIQMQGNAIAVNDGSLVLVQNQGNETSGTLEVKATQSISLDGTSADGIVGSGLYTDALGEGKGGSIFLATSELNLTAGASLVTFSLGDAASGDIKLEIADSLTIVGFAEINPNKFTTVSAQTYGAGDAGGIEVMTQNLTISDGGNIASVTGGLGTGSGGNIIVNASESIDLVGVNPIALAPSQITAGSGGAGSAGNVTLQTKSLNVEGGGRVDASATAAGNAGNLTIDASESIVIKGGFANSRNPSLIIASANILDLPLRQLFGLPDSPSGNSGSVTINTSQLTVMDGAQVTVRNEGTGNAGNIEIQADSINLNGEGGITGAVKSGTGGIIDIAVADSVNLTSGGQIKSDNEGAGDGGKIIIAANSLNISDGSFITTTSFGSGQGGDINLDIDESLNIKGTGFRQFQETFQTNALNGSLKAGTRGTGIFIGTSENGRGGNLQIETNSLSLTEGGIIFSPIFADGDGGDIRVDAAEIEIVGSALQINAGVESTTMASAGNINIDTDRLVVSDGGTIFNGTFGDAAGGNIDIAARESVTLKSTPDGLPIFTGIYANTSIGNGKGGDVSIQSDNLSIDDALISSSTGGFISDVNELTFKGGGDGGNITLDIAETIETKGIPIDPRFASGISSTSFTNGAAGDISISSNRLFVRDGSEISATTIGSGDGGNLTITATDSVELTGTTTDNNMQRGGLIAASGRDAFIDRVASGISGNINLTAGNLTIDNGASIDVQSLGTGDAGNLDIEVENTVSLDRGTISAATNSGEGGNITLEAGNVFWLGESTTTARARNDADGGNIKIRGRNLVVLESSQLTAGANMGRGGNINVDAQGLFVCSQCIVSASSRLGIDGAVNIDTLERNSNLDIAEVPIELTQPNETVAQACSVAQKPNDSKLTIGGRGGLPTRPSEALRGESIVSMGVPQNSGQITKSHNINSTKLPAPAQNWHLNSQGVVVLTAKSATTASNSIYNSPDCHAR